MSASLRRSERELLEWNRRQAEVVAGFAERYERTTAPSRRAGSAALDRRPYYIPADEPPEGSAPFDAYAGPKAAEIAAARAQADAAMELALQEAAEAKAVAEQMRQRLAALEAKAAAAEPDGKEAVRTVRFA